MAFADRGLEFLLDLGLRFTQHVLDDALSALRVIARGVPTLPAAIFAFPDVALSVCSSLWHKISLLCQRTISVGIGYLFLQLENTGMHLRPS